MAVALYALVSTVRQAEKDLSIPDQLRQMNKANVRLLSITQPTASDPAGGMTRRLFSVFDEYQSKENGKHTLRAMNENARQGFFNGSRPPFGFRTVETERPGRRGKKKR